MRAIIHLRSGASSKPGENPVQLQPPQLSRTVRKKKKRKKEKKPSKHLFVCTSYYIITGCQMNVTLVLFLFPPKMGVHRG